MLPPLLPPSNEQKEAAVQPLLRTVASVVPLPPLLHPAAVGHALDRLQPWLPPTPLLSSRLLNEALGARLFFKCEGFQKVGAFKARGALNTLLTWQEEGCLPQHVVAYSSGNHAQAVAWAAAQLGVRATVIMPHSASPLKRAATLGYGAHVHLTATRQEAEALADSLSQAEHTALLPPYDHDGVIAGQGTAAWEAWQQEGDFDAVFAPCGGGGLLSGTWLATQHHSPLTPVFGAEPTQANDAAMSYRTGVLHRWEHQPATLADGVRTLGLSPRTFAYVRQVAGVHEVEEEALVYWLQWLSHLLKVAVEPTAALGMAAAAQWMAAQQAGSSAKIC